MRTVPDDDAPEGEGPFWNTFNIVITGIILAVFAFLFVKFDLEGLLNIAKAAIGLSFVIFIHELGHFLAAKWCDVNVTTFSIGFGPAIPGCKFKWGETTYMLAILPLGGYVQMVGQVDGDESSDGSEEDPRSYRRKSVGQRMLIISAGVMMNAILAVVCFIYVYQGPGKEHQAAVINYVDSGSPAFRHGLRSGAAILKIGDIDKNPTFTDLMQTVVASSAGESIPVVYQLPGQAPVATSIEPRKTESDSKPFIGVSYPPVPRFAAKRGIKNGPFMDGTPAAKAKFEYGDIIIAMTDPDDPAQAKDYRPDRLKDLPADPRPGAPAGQHDYFEFVRRLQLLAGKTIVLKVRRTDAEKDTEVNIEVEPIFRLDLGVRMKMGPVLAVREGSPADQHVNPPNAADKLEGDLIESVKVTDADGKTLEFKGDTLDPERLPLQLRQWSDRMDQAKRTEPRIVTLQVRRHRAQAGAQFESKEIKLAWDKSWRFDRAAPVSATAPMPIPELGLAYQITTTVAGVTRDDSPLQVGDVVKDIQYEFENFKDDGKSPWTDDSFAPGQWANIALELFQRPYHFKKLEFKVQRGKEDLVVEIPLHTDQSAPLTDRGWGLATDMRRVKADGMGQAISMGFKDTGNFMLNVFQSLRGIATRRISVKQIGGPFMIAEAAYRYAGRDFGDFVFFLGLISINLAVVNFLPVPVLDGGHMVFLIYESIRRKPAPEAVRNAATWVGLAMIASLMLFVLCLDTLRIFFTRS